MEGGRRMEDGRRRMEDLILAIFNPPPSILDSLLINYAWTSLA
jgi:hypothetical protein